MVIQSASDPEDGASSVDSDDEDAGTVRYFAVSGKLKHEKTRKSRDDRLEFVNHLTP